MEPKYLRFIKSQEQEFFKHLVFQNRITNINNCSKLELKPFLVPGGTADFLKYSIEQAHMCVTRML